MTFVRIAQAPPTRHSRSMLLVWLVSGPVAHADLPDVIVTTNRRDESNQQVPVGIAAIGADDAEKLGVADAQSLAGLVPGLLFNRQANASTPFLRGVGSPVYSPAPPRTFGVTTAKRFE